MFLTIYVHRCVSFPGEPITFPVPIQRVLRLPLVPPPTPSIIYDDDGPSLLFSPCVDAKRFNTNVYWIM